MRMTAEAVAAMCEGKQAFATYDDAEKIALRRRARRKGPIMVEPYKCRHCGKFHLAGRGKR